MCSVALSNVQRQLRRRAAAGESLPTFGGELVYRRRRDTAAVHPRRRSFEQIVRRALHQPHVLQQQQQLLLGDFWG